MTESERREVAQRIADERLMDAEFCIVYEDEDLLDASEDDWRAIHDLITKARATLPDEEGE